MTKYAFLDYLAVGVGAYVIGKQLFPTKKGKVTFGNLATMNDLTVFIDEYPILQKSENYNALVEGAIELGVAPNWLAGVMFMESKFRPDVKAKNSTASGLIQFMRKTALHLGTTTAKLRAMSFAQQMKYVVKYYNQFPKQLNNVQGFLDLYLITFYPYAVNQGDSYVFGSEDSMATAREIGAVNNRHYTFLASDGHRYVSKKSFREGVRNAFVQSAVGRKYVNDVFTY